MLRAHGVGPGDRVGILLPMLPETVVAVLALGQLQAIYTPDLLGLRRARRSRRGWPTARPRVLITADGFLRRGAVVPLKATADAAVAMAPSGRAGAGRRGGWPATPQASVDGRPRRLVARGAGRARLSSRSRETPTTDPETPYMIIYTSGTTGRPKGAVHVHGGFPIKGAQDLAHDFDLRPGRPAVLVHRPRLDDGPLGDLRRAAARRRARPLRGRARLSRARTDCGRSSPATASPTWASRRPSSGR